MLKLEAVNSLLDAIAESHATALDTGGTSLEGQAETLLDKWDKDIQGRGWHYNTFYKIELSPPDTTIAYSVDPSGTFLAGETITETTSLATGRFHEIVSSKLYITQDADSDDFTGSQVLTGAISLATVTGTTLAAVTEGRILVDSDVLEADTDGVSFITDVSLNAGALYNITDDTDVFDSDITLVQIEQLTFTGIPSKVATYIVATAAYYFHRKLIGFSKELSDLMDERNDARREAHKYDADQSDANILTTTRARRLQGQSGLGGHTRGSYV